MIFWIQELAKTVCQIIRQLWCWNHHYSFVRNIYGDEILWTGGRSWWKCDHCNKRIISQSLHVEN